MSDAPTLLLRVVEAQRLNPLVRLFRLQRPDGGPLPPFSAGAHVRVRVHAGSAEAWRHYSLVVLDAETGAFDAPRTYTIAVRRDDHGRGGSRFMHEQVAEGDMLQVSGPRNDFPLREHAGTAVLIAGGIGITPLVSMASACVLRGRPVRLYYAARSRTLMVFVPQLQRLLGSALQLHADDENHRPLDIEAIVLACAPQDVLYVCGPAPLLGAAQRAAQRAGWARERLFYERFQEPPPDEADRAFTVRLARSGRTLAVPPQRTLLEVLEEAGCDVLSDCRRGECGVCRVEVIDGEIDHRDHVLSDAERASGKVMQICVSRARGSWLELDL